MGDGVDPVRSPGRVGEDLAFLAEAGAVLDASLDYAETLQQVARLAVPRLGDYCLVDVIEPDGSIRRVATAHRDPAKEHLLRQTVARALTHERHPAVRALATGEPVVEEGVTEATWVRIAHDEAHLRVLRALGPHAWMFVPLTARARSLGTVAFVLSEPGRTFSVEDRLLAAELSRRAALAVDNARLYTAEKQERERLYALFMQAPAAISIVRGPDFRFELSNPLNQELALGRELVGRTVRDALPELAAQGLTERLEEVYRSGQPYLGREVPVTLSTSAGPTTRYLNGVYHPLRDARGAVEGVMMFAYDVTEQVLARQQVEEGERLFRTLTSHAPVGIFLTSPEGDCEYVNPRWCELAGLSPGEAAGKGWANALHPDDRERLFREWYEAAASGGAFESQYRFLKPDGRVSWLQGTSVPIRDPSGAITGHIGTVTDVTERKKAEAEREQLLADLQQAVRLRDDFLSIASHELRTPLTTMRLHVELLDRMLRRQGAEPATPRVQGKLEKIEQQVSRIEGLIRTLLDVSRITQGRLELRPEDMDLGELAREVLARFSEELEEVGCAVRLDAGAVQGRWDRLRLDQVLTNLITNAMKYGKGRPIEMAVEATPDRATFSIADHGIGVPGEARERIFERFERAVSHGHYGGLGLGLWIARQIVLAHGGAIRVDDTPGGGSTFTVELPR